MDRELAEKKSLFCKEGEVNEADDDEENPSKRDHTDEAFAKDPENALEKNNESVQVDDIAVLSSEDESVSVSDDFDPEVDTEVVQVPPRNTGTGTATQVGAFAVAGPEHDSSTVTVDNSDVLSHSDDLITAELVDQDKEQRLVQKQVQESLQREREKTPIAQVVQERFCDRRSGVILIILALFVVLGIVLGTTLSSGRDPPAVPPPKPVPLKEEILEILATVSFDDGESLLVPGSPQNRALNWVANDTFKGYYTDEKLIQRYSLATLFYSTDGSGWTNNSLWLDNGDECGRWWQPIGVISCDSPTGGITTLAFGKNNLEGTVPIELGLLSSLVELDLSQNDLAGTIPMQIGNLISLESLNLKASKLIGEIPPTLANVATLKSLNLAENQLTGTFVFNIGKLTSLEDLQLHDNLLEGKLPDDISNLKNMKNLDLGTNKLNGTIPTGIGQLSLVAEVTLYQNSLSGSIPSQFGLLTSVSYLSLRGNSLTGTIPSDIGNLKLLTSLSFRQNHLTGTIPPSISELTNIGEPSSSLICISDASSMTFVSNFPWLQTGSISELTSLRDRFLPASVD